jgi:hypothetical protein
MPVESAELDKLQSGYKEAVETWVATIRQEEALASGAHSVTAIDTWEAAGFAEAKARETAKKAKWAYENALREEFFGF